MTTFSDFIETPSKDVSVLLEVTPRERLSNWTQVAGLSNSFSKEWSNFIQTDIVPGGLYRKTTEVIVNKIALTEVGSISAVESTPGSWYFQSENDNTLAILGQAILGRAILGKSTETEAELIKTVSGLIESDDFNRADSTTVGGNWNEVSGDWEIVSNHVEEQDTGGLYYLENQASTGGEMFIQSTVEWTTFCTGGLLARFDFSTVDGYGVIVNASASDFRLVRWVGGSSTLLDDSANGEVDYSDPQYTQIYLADGVQEVGIENNIGSQPVKLTGSDTSHDGANSRTAGYRFSSFGGQNSRLEGDDFLWMRDKNIVVSSLETGDQVAILNISGQTVVEGNESGGSITLDCSIYGGVTEQVPFDGWTSLIVYDSEGTEKARASNVYPGDQYSFSSNQDEVFIHTPNSNDPSSNTVIFTKFRLHFSTTPKIFDDIYYEPRLSGDGLPAITEETDDLFFGLTTKKVSSGNIQLTNADAMFDKLAARFTWKEAECKLFIGGDDLTHTPGGGLDYALFGTFLVENISPRLDHINLQIRDIQKITDRQLPVNFIDTDKFPNAPTSNLGKALPILFGSKSNISPILVDSTKQKGEYQIADFNFQTLHQVSDIYVDGTALSPSDYEISTSGCSFTILSAYAGATPSGSSVTCDAIGQPARGKAWETSTDYLKYYGEIVSEIYTNYLGITSSGIKASSATGADTTASVVQAAYIDSRASARQFIRKFEVGVLGKTFRNNEGQIEMFIWNPNFGTIDGSKSIEDPEVANFEAVPQIENAYSTIKVTYDRDPSNDSTSVETANNELVKLLRLDGRDRDLTIDTFLTTQVDAQVLAQRASLLFENVSTVLKIHESGLKLMNSEVLDPVRVTLDRAPSLTGDYTNFPFEIKKIVKKLSPVPTVEVTLDDFLGISSIGNIGTWVEDSVPDYSSASESERSIAGFWTDDDGFADPSDDESDGKSVWW